MSPLWFGAAGLGVIAIVTLLVRSLQSSRSSHIDRGEVSTSWLAEHRAGPGES